jgi:predicted RNase H-like HicB family nuclease
MVSKHPSGKSLPGRINRTNIKIRTFDQNLTMERIINLHIEKLPEGFFLATSDSVQGLVAQGRTLTETIEIAKDVAEKLVEAMGETFVDPPNDLSDHFDYPIVISI